MSYRHVRQPLNRTIHRDLIILRMVDDGVMPKQIPRLVPAVSVHSVYHAIYRRKTFPKLYEMFHKRQSCETLRIASLEIPKSNV